MENKPKLSLFSDWKYCNACGKPPNQGQPLMTCHNCKSVAYHDAKCQRQHWTQHKQDCKHLAKMALPPLQHFRTMNSNWYNRVPESTRQQSSQEWEMAYQAWQQQDYLTAVEGFQASLEPFQRQWKQSLQEKSKTTAKEDDETMNGSPSWPRQLAARLIFCAYCELDTPQTIHPRQDWTCRERLVQALMILVRDCEQNPTVSTRHGDLLSDAWMELMLSMEEVQQHRILARHVAQLAIASSSKWGGSCGWTHALQRPGYMAPELSSSPPYIARSQHPQWCRILEEHSEGIRKEYQSLTVHNPHGFSPVGSGDRGSGQDDHRVVTGTDWSEYVLFGTGAQPSPYTQGLLRQYVPDAVSLAEQGGGEVIFSRLAPKTHIHSHCGPTNLRWTAHLGLQIPADTMDSRCQIQVADTWYNWQVGKMLLFDDSYEHQVVNSTNQERVVLLLRIWHPELPVGARQEHLLQARARKGDTIDKRYHPPS